MATLTVGNGGYGSISDAITAAANGDTIIVSPGTWTLPVTISKALTFLGANAGTSANDSDGGLNGGRVAETIIDGGNATTQTFLTTAGLVTFDGFTFNHQHFVSNIANSSIALVNNVITNPTDNLLFEGNVPDLVTLENNRLTGITPGPNNLDSVFIGGDWNGTTGTHINFVGNVLTGSPGGLGFNLGNVTGTIANNTFDGLTDYALLLANNTDVVVTGNIFEHIVSSDPSVSPTFGAGVRTYNPGTAFGLHLDGNTFIDDYVGLGVRLTSEVAPGAITMTNNVFAGNATDILNQGATTTDLTPSGDNTFESVLLSDATEAQLLALADKIVDSVDDANYGSVVLKPGNVYLTANSFYAPDTTSPSLQRAIDTAHDGDIIHVGAGAYSGLATTAVDNLTVTAPADATGLEVALGAGIHNITLAGDSNIDVTGNDSSNVIVGNAGSNVIDGGPGDDTETFSGVRAEYHVALLENGDIQFADRGADGGTDTARNVEHFTFSDGDFSAASVLTPPSIDITLSGTSIPEASADGTVVGTLAAPGDFNPGGASMFSLIDDAGGRFAIDGSNLVVADGTALDFEQSASEHVTVRVTDSDNVMFDKDFDISITDVEPETVASTDGPDVIVTGADDADVNGGAGADSILGDIGNDLLGGGTGDDSVAGGAGADTVWGEDGNDNLGGDDGADTIIGGAGDDTIGGDAGNDELNGGDGSDVIFGGAGDDQIGGGTGDDTLIGGAGNDTIWAEDGNDTVNAGAGNDLVLAGAGNDQVGGGAGDDDLRGEAGNDVLWGEDGNDTLTGGPGDDVMIGGAGHDTFIFAPGDGHDIITDFTASGADADHIWLAGTDLHSFADVLAHASFNPATGATTITHNGTETITLNSVPSTSLTAGDFIFT